MQRNFPVSHKRGRADRGYVLLTLLLLMAALAIASAVAVSDIAFNIRRDREEELIHRGVQYRRAIRQYSKKTGRFPVRMEELDNTNGLRYLRKHYTDPVTGRPFKFVYMSEIQVGALAPPNADPSAAANGAPGISAGAGNNSAQINAAVQPAAPGDSPDGTSDSAKPASSDSAATNANRSTISASGSQQPIIGGLIVGVVSTSKDQTIRQFNGKNRYNQWRFFYDPSFDQYALMNTPTVMPTFQTPPKLENSENPGTSVNPPSAAAARAAPSYQ